MSRAYVAFVGVLAAGCWPLVTSDEVANAPSPNDEIVARLYEVNGGATTDFAYRVSLTSRGFLGSSTDVGSFYGATRSNCAYGVNLRWRDSNTLVIEYLNAKEAKISDARVGRRKIHVIGKSGVADGSAPCGGMLYNLQRRQSSAVT